MDKTPTNGGKYISLQPFIHQVGGHSSMLCLDEATVCKPVVERERLFYETLPENLRMFVPLYYGVVKVGFIQDGDYIILSATSPENYSPKPSTTLKRLRLRKNGSIEVEGVTVLFESDQAYCDYSAAMNPWVLKCHKEYITRLTARMDEDSTPMDFLVLENLTWRFSLPCILDLKMGTRQYGDNDTLSKRQSKMVKVLSTTSAKLGVRIGGMQVYQVNTGRFLCRNKLYGRTLTAVGFQNAVRSFLHDGTRLRKDALPPLIRRLEELRNTLTQLESVRLYTTSLLLLYEGRHPTEAVPEGDHVSGGSRGRPTGESEKSSRASSADRDNDLFKLQTSEYRQRSSSCNPHKKHLKPVDLSEEEPLTDVRIIDFAHSTHRGMNDSVAYSGPDNGFLFGVNNMIQLLKAILSDSQ